jgi:MoaA/NifB/PqqE/SkfB family radical SAM enzyme
MLDASKVAWHMDRVEAWERGERIAPITIDMALTRACNAACWFCYAQLQESTERKYLDTEVMRRFLDDCAEVGVRGISLVSDGESTLSPAFEFTVKYGHTLGIDMACGTNGWILTPEKADAVLPHLTYLRFNISAGTPKRYAEIMGMKEEDFHRVVANARYMVEAKRRHGYPVTLGFQMVYEPRDQDQLLPFAQLAVDVGVDYAVIKHTSDDERGSLGVRYDKYRETYPLLRQVEALSTTQTQIVVKWNKIGEMGRRAYARCFGAPFILQISGSGLVAPCGMLFGAKYSKFHIGNIAEESFKSIWQSDRYWATMSYLASEKFDARRMCGALCLQHLTNDALDRHVKGLVPLVQPSGTRPAHVNFI